MMDGRGPLVVARHRGARGRAGAAAGDRGGSASRAASNAPRELDRSHVRSAAARWSRESTMATSIVRERLKVYQRQTQAARRLLLERGRRSGRSTATSRPTRVDGGRSTRRSPRTRRPEAWSAVIVCKSAAEIERMRRANVLVATCSRSCAMVAPGVTTADLDAAAERLVRARVREPAFKGYRGYPATLCTSVNDEVVHGIPSKRALLEGDIMSLDMGVKLDGFFGDSAMTVPVGTVPTTAAAAAGDAGGAARASRRCGSAAGSRISATRCRSTSRRTGFRWCASSSGTASAPQLHEEPQIAELRRARPGAAAGRGHGAGDRADGEHGASRR